MCCDSAHKTLPVVTGGAYLHLAHDASVQDEATVRGALALFGSTSPSYLILQSAGCLQRGAGRGLSPAAGAVLRGAGRSAPQPE